MRIISFEEACELPKNLFNIDIKNEPIIKEASENNNCKIVLGTSSSPPSIDILYKDDTISNNVIGFLIGIYPQDISVWLAIDHDGDIDSYVTVGTFNRNSSLNEVISKCKKAINICPVCGKYVPYYEQHRFSFAGRCCEDCLPKMRAEHEKPGWYN